MTHEICKPTDPGIIRVIDDAFRRWGREDDGLGFVPWVGEQYGNSKLFGARRILVLGESHYEWCKECAKMAVRRDRNLTCWCIADVLSGFDTNPHWTKIANALAGENGDMDKRQQFWQSIAYSNMIQEIVGFKAEGERAPEPTEQMYVLGQTAFEKIATILLPDFIVVLGFDLWQQLPSQENAEYSYVHTGDDSTSERYNKLECYGYEYGGKKMMALRVLHPAGGLGSTWNPVLRKAMGM